MSLCRSLKQVWRRADATGGGPGSRAAEHGSVRERRAQRTHPPYAAPELLAERPNEVWSWDISKLKGPAKWTYVYLYVILDVYSRYAVGWTVQHRESAALAKALIAQAVDQQHIARHQLTVHPDCGSSMTSKPVAFLLADLAIARSHNRPYTSLHARRIRWSATFAGRGARLSRQSPVAQSGSPLQVSRV